MSAHNGSGFDSNIDSKNLPQRISVVLLIANGASIVSLKKINGYVKNKNPHHVHFRCGTVHVNNSLRKRRGRSYKL